MILGAIYIVWISGSDFIYVFEGFLITLGVPMAAWCGVFLADLLLRRRDYDEAGPLRRARAVRRRRLAGRGLDGGRDGRRLGAGGRALRLARAWAGWGTSSSPFGLGGKTGTWAFANLGVPIALAIGFVGYLLLGAYGVRRQEREPGPAACEEVRPLHR